MPVSSQAVPGHHLYCQVTALQIHAVDVGDFQLAPGRGFDVPGDFQHIVVIKIKSCHRVTGAGCQGFPQCRWPGRRHQIPPRRSARDPARSRQRPRRRIPAQRPGAVLGEAAAVENIVTQHQGHRGIGNKIGPQYEGLGQAVGAGLDGIAQLNTPLPTVTQQFGKRRLVLGGGDNQDLPNAGPHQGGQGVVDHRFGIDRH